MTIAATAQHGVRRWAILAVGLLGQAATCLFLYGLPMVLPALREQDGVSLTTAGVIVGAPSVGLLCTLIAWGAAADRFGERRVMALGLALAAVLLVGATQVHGVVELAVVLGAAGAAAGSVNAASGRLVMGWFAGHERGFAMGVRQTAQPLGVAVAALTLPSLSHHVGVRHAMFLPALACGVMAVLVMLIAIDPTRPARVSGQPTASPYRGGVLWRVHLSSAALVVPQFAVAGFTLVYLVDQRGWSAVDAGRLVFCAQLAGAAGRIGSGVWSDRIGSRLRPMRQLAVASAAVMLVLCLGAAAHSWIVIVGFVVGAIVTVADNGLAFTAVAEMAGTAWAGRALGVQNTGQNVAAGLTPAVVGAIVTGCGYSWAFAIVAIAPLLAVGLIPVFGEAAAATLNPPCAASSDTSETGAPSR
ncbi:MAG: MFS transporter [Jatrophihabitans sp.]